MNGTCNLFSFSQLPYCLIARGNWGKWIEQSTEGSRMGWMSHESDCMIGKKDFNFEEVRNQYRRNFLESGLKINRISHRLKNIISNFFINRFISGICKWFINDDSLMTHGDNSMINFIIHWSRMKLLRIRLCYIKVLLWFYEVMWSIVRISTRSSDDRLSVIGEFLNGCYIFLKRV